MPFELIITAILIAAVSGMPGLFMSRSSASGQRIAVLLMVCSSLAGLSGAWAGLCSGQVSTLFFPWPAEGNSVIGIDALSAFFLVPIFLVGGLGPIYGLGYWPQRKHQSNGRSLSLFWGLLVAGMALLVSSRHAMVFILGWELMALSAFFLITVEDHRSECRRVGWIYLIATHIGTLSLFAMFVLWRWSTGSYALQTVTGNASGMLMMNSIFLLSLLGFGLKAGIIPLHFWLPGAHANAPSHVSAIMSGVIIKMGIYGLLRILSLLPGLPEIWGWLVFTLGLICALFGVVFAIAQHDIKRLLAYHSIENIGIILLGLGLALIGRSTGHPGLVVLGLAGCLLHVWNHALFKSLLFLCAGSVIHRTGIRQIDRLGGLAKNMPWTAALFVIGAIAICGLPPLNGFVSEWFIYLGLLRPVITGGTGGAVAVFGVPVLAMTGALAAACFVKVYGTVFLGSPRDYNPADVEEVPFSMRFPMIMLAACCVLIGMVPVAFGSVLDSVISCWMPESGLQKIGVMTSLKTVSIIAVLLVAGMTTLLIVLAFCRRNKSPQVGTWDCGYACPTSRMQYTGSSFAGMVVNMFRWILRPHEHRPRLTELFFKSAEMDSHVDDAVLDRLIVPFSNIIERRAGWFRKFQQGLTQYYILYILIIVILMLSTLVPIDELIAHWYGR
ncbi:MAG: proton-conducting transporter membrane subunit [Victivallaceae bacterium]